MVNDANYEPTEEGRRAFQDGIKAGFEMTRDVISTKIVDNCKRRWLHRLLFCSCKQLLLQVTSMEIQLNVHEDSGSKFSDDEPIFTDEG